MTSLREVIRRLVVGRRPAADPPRPEYSYTLYWVKTVRQWDAARRRAAIRAVQAQLAAPAFTPNEYRRRYRVPEVDDRPHSGLSLLALVKVLEAFEEER